MLQFAEVINKEVIKRANAVRRIKNAIVESFGESEKETQLKCCPHEQFNFTIDPRFPGEVTIEATVCVISVKNSKYRRFVNSVSSFLPLSGCESLWWLRGQPHRFSFSIQLESPCAPPWAASSPCRRSTWRRRAISFSVFLDSVVHERLPRGFAWHTHPLHAFVYVHTISVWPHVPYPNAGCYSNDATAVIISFPVLQTKTKNPG